jgi:antitoxin YefM
MYIVNYSEARQNLKSLIDKVWEDSAPVFITAKGGKNVVLMSMEEFESYDETSYLTSTKANKKALEKSLAEPESSWHKYSSVEELFNEGNSKRPSKKRPRILAKKKSKNLQKN